MKVIGELMFEISKIEKITFVVAFIVLLVAKYAVYSEILSDISFVIMALIFIHALVKEVNKSR